MDYHLRLSRVKESGFICFQQSLKTDVKLIFNSPILIEMSNSDLKRLCKAA